MLSSLLGIAVLIFQIYVIIHIFKEQKDMTRKVVWTLVAFFIPLLGSLFYWFFVRTGKFNF